MTKPVIVENMEDCPGVVRIDTEVWKRGPGASREQPAPDPAPTLDKPKYQVPAKE